MPEYITNAPNLYANGCGFSVNIGGVRISVDPGQVRDSTNNFDLVLPTTTNIVMSVSGGINSLDTGTLAQNQSYDCYVVGDSRGFNQTGVMATLNNGPGLHYPNGYDISRYIGSVPTLPNSATLQAAGCVGGGNYRYVFYQGNPANLVCYNSSPGTNFINVSLFPWVPFGFGPRPSGSPAYLAFQYTGSTPGTSKCQIHELASGAIATGLFTVPCYVASTATYNYLSVPTSNSTTISIAATDGSVSISVLGYWIVI